MSGNFDVTGYAIVSDDDKIAGPGGMTPVSLRNEKDWELYQRAQDEASLVVFARRSHELEPNLRGFRGLSFPARRRRGSSSARTAGGGTRCVRVGKMLRRDYCRRAAVSP